MMLVYLNEKEFKLNPIETKIIIKILKKDFSAKPGLSFLFTCGDSEILIPGELAVRIPILNFTGMGSITSGFAEGVNVKGVLEVYNS